MQVSSKGKLRAQLSFTMAGYYMNAFGSKWLHFGNLVFQTAIGPKPPYVQVRHTLRRPRACVRPYWPPGLRMSDV